MKQAEDDIAVTKYLYEMYLDTTVTKFLDQSQDDIAVTKYLNGPAEFQENDISVTKFLESSEDGIAVTKYLG